jgi:hypothetical protein
MAHSTCWWSAPGILSRDAQHGHSFLTIDRKTEELSATIDDRAYLMSVGRAVLARQEQ